MPEPAPRETPGDTTGGGTAEAGLRTARQTSGSTSTGSRSRDALKRRTAGRLLMTTPAAAHTTCHRSGAPYWTVRAATAPA